MISEKGLKLITENVPEHFWKTWNLNVPNHIKINWLRKFLKKDISKKEFIEFVENKAWYSKFEDYEKSLHFLILKDAFQIDLSGYDWFYRNNNYNNIDFDRHFKLWQLRIT
jgi:hypothetical protein